VTEYNLTPKTRRTLAERIRVGDVVMESYEHPAVVTRVLLSAGRVHIRARYVWKDNTELDWKLGAFRPGSPVHKAVK
jgi:hypothetical protein